MRQKKSQKFYILRSLNVSNIEQRGTGVMSNIYFALSIESAAYASVPLNKEFHWLMNSEVLREI